MSRREGKGLWFPSLLMLLAAVASCQGDCSARVCDPDCKHFETCDLETQTCRPRTCSEASDCGPARFYACKPRSDGAPPPYVCVPLGCVSDEDCTDDRFCTGLERCAPLEEGADAFGCRPPSGPVCSAEETCNESFDRCERQCPNPDADRDGVRSLACGGNDCDDDDPERRPGAPEVCDAADKDEDCDPTTFGSRDLDSDGFVDAACCNANGASLACGDDCNDTDRQVHPTAPEVCNGQDDDCDGNSDFEVQLVAYPDGDRDGYGKADAGSVRICDVLLGQGYSVYANDCDDENAAVTPGTFVCVGGQFPNQVQVCQGGLWTAVICPSGTVCVTQPTGIGICR